MKFFGGLSGSAWQGILTQYFDTGGYISSNVTASPPFNDERHTAPVELEDGEGPDNLVNEIDEAIKLQNKSAEKKQISRRKTRRTTRKQNFGNANTTPSSPCSRLPGPLSAQDLAENFGLRHSVERAGSSYTFVPGLIGSQEFHGCVGEAETSKLTSHEYAESATDPFGGGWRSAGGQEIADLCQLLGPMTIESADNLNGSVVQPLGTITCNPPARSPIRVHLASWLLLNRVGSVRAHSHAEWIIPENLATTYKIEYGTTTSYGSVAAEGSVSGFNLQTIHQTVSNLP